MAYIGLKTVLNSELSTTNEDEGDLFLEADGSIGVLVDTSVTEKKRAAAQGIAARLRLLKGEYFLNLLEGIPYFQRILVKNPSLPLIRGIITEAIFTYPGVISVPRLDLNWNRVARTLSVEFDVKITGDIILTSEQYGDLVLKISLDERTTST